MDRLTRRNFIHTSGIAVIAGAFTCRALGREEEAFDVCVYGATAGGIAAAVAAAREGSRVILVEPTRWLGGMTGGGLSHVDWGRKEAVGGIALSILKHGYNDSEYRKEFAKLLEENGIRVVYEHRVSSVEKEGPSIRALVCDHAPPDRLGCPLARPATAGAMRIPAKVFIDCSYEGDVMALAGISHTRGREARSEYGESLAGVRPDLAVYDIDPYRTPGDPKSGLLPLLQGIRMPAEGEADRLSMGYGFRWKFSTGEDRLPIGAPEDYDPRTFELYRRGFQGGVNMEQGRRMNELGVYSPEWGAVHKMGAGNLSRSLWASTNFGNSAGYPEGDWTERAKIWKWDQEFMRQITHFILTDPSVPEGLKSGVAGIGFQPGIFDDTEGCPHQLYVREARRLRSTYVVTQKDLEGTTDPEDSIGLASYGVDDWPYATYARDGKVALNGGEFSELYLDPVHRGIYKIPYRAIVPKKEECGNLFVPVCCSASHIAMTSIRMEPVWMVLGESAGIAASMAVSRGAPVQDVAYQELRRKLLERKQILERPA